MKHGSIILFVLSFVLLSCERTGLAVEEQDSKARLVVVYMVADNNLDYFALQDINEMERGFPKHTKDRLVVYIDRRRGGNPSHPYLMEIIHDETDALASKILLTYPEQNSANAETLKSTLEDVFKYYSDEHFSSEGLFLWSHGNAWLPPGSSIFTSRGDDDPSNKKTTSSKSFGLDDTPQASNMDIKQLAMALGSYHFNFIAFDACFMSAIEVIYELRNVTDYMIASPTEILSTGFPYQSIVPLLFEEKIDVKKIAKNYFEDYNNKLGLLKSASIAVIKMSEIEQLTTQIYNFTTALSSTTIKPIHKNDMQQLDRFDGKWVYDMKDFLGKMAKENNLQESYNKVLEQWDKTVIYENHTSNIVNTLNLKNCNGVSTYIPNVITHERKVNEYYKTLSWFRASGYNQIFTDF